MQIDPSHLIALSSCVFFVLLFVLGKKKFNSIIGERISEIECDVRDSADKLNKASVLLEAKRKRKNEIAKKIDEITDNSKTQVEQIMINAKLAGDSEMVKYAELTILRTQKLKKEYLESLLKSNIDMAILAVEDFIKSKSADEGFQSRSLNIDWHKITHKAGS